MAVLQHTEYDRLLRELWNDEVNGDHGLAASDVGSNSNRRIARHNHLEQALHEGWAEVRYSGPRGGRRYHSIKDGKWKAVG
jgi:hypothetical protein|tara:strand:+ start:648 stop:890 length:243 start_codon:yes stop_codon:yes gene_type:complete